MYPVTDEYLAAKRAPFREERITGAIKLKDGTKIVVDNSSIAQGTLSMTRQAFKSDKFDIGMLSCAVLNIRLKDERAYDHEFSGALVRLKYGIVTAAAEDGTKTWYDVPLPPFYVNGHGTRQRNFIKLTAYDPVRLLSAALPADVPTTSLYAALQYICAMCGIAIGTSEAEFNVLPNSGVIPDFTSESIETCADAVMWIAQTVNCCAFCDYHGWLVFRQYRYDGGNTYNYLFTAARRAKIEYSDTRTYLAYLQSYVGNDVKTYSNLITWTGTDAPHIKEGSMSLLKNPILKKLTADQQETVNKNYLLFANRGHSTRYVKSTGFVDPVLEPFDVVAFSGGSIDIGQIISVATKIVWKFRGNGTVYCTNVSENGEVASSTSEQSGDDEISAYSVEESAVSVRVQPKSQLEKRVDELEAQCGSTTAESLDRKLSNGSHVTLVPTSSEILLFSYQGKCVAALRGTNSTTSPKNRDADGVELFTSDQNFSATIGAWGGGIRGEYSDSNTGNSARLLISDDSRFEVETTTKSSREQYYGNISIKVGTITFRVAGASNSLYYDDGKNTLLFEDGALRINGKKVLTEE